MVNKKFGLIKTIIILPGAVLVVIPAVILHYTRPFYLFCGISFPAALAPLFVGLCLINIGVIFAATTVQLFFNAGEGTPAPWDPPKKFVVAGPYCYVRNPMILSVLAVLLGESLVFGSMALFIFFAFFWALNLVYFKYFEEPGLVRRFGAEYIEYAKNVGRWIPRKTPWKP